jgi:hypothetical protein
VDVAEMLPNQHLISWEYQDVKVRVFRRPKTRTRTTSRTSRVDAEDDRYPAGPQPPSCPCAWTQT